DEEDEEGIGGQQLGQDQRPERVDEAEPLENRVLRDQDNVNRQHDGADHEGEKHTAQPEAQPGEGVGGQRAGGDVADHRAQRDDQRVGQEGPDAYAGRAAEDLAVVADYELLRQEAQTRQDLVG